MKVYLNGKLVDKAKATVSVFDHGLLYGDGVFEGIRAYNGRIFRLEEHIDRLLESAKTIALKIGMSKKKLIEATVATCKANNIKNGYIRLVVTRGVGSLGLNPYLCSKPQIIIIADSLKMYSKELYENGLSVVTAATCRNLNEALSPRVKSLNYLNNIMAKIEALNAGCMEALMLNAQGLVAEASGDNIFIIKGKKVITPSKDMGILEGITRNAVMELARAKGLEVIECAMTRHDVFTADECFLTGTGAEVIPVITLDNRKIGTGKPGRVTKALIAAFTELTMNEGVEIQ